MLLLLSKTHMTCDQTEWTECLEYGGQVDTFYSDFEKAFDKVPHKRLISKLQSICRIRIGFIIINLLSIVF